ncbi:MAG TPA: hypothetical protein VGS97_21480 [Actinocrinis sp.]|uniref:hypothetical protein n=1 Tax=Actinocrinis sp. TaxID=1920516 RepID=UPI002DDD680E|nr:hypothetical protein [Actinocrinis sp.]HEV2346687.1 hypothetical protein [Actinocrinis sp.]
MKGETFRLTRRQLVTTVGLASLPVAGGIYALRRPEWFLGGTAWTFLSGVLILIALSTIGDRTRIDASGISVRRFLVYQRWMSWSWIETVYETAPPGHHSGRMIAIRLVGGERVTLPAPLHLPAVPDPQYFAKVETLLTFAPRDKVPSRRRANRSGSVQTARVTKRRTPVGSRVLRATWALFAVASLVGVAGSLNSLHYNRQNAAAFNAAPPCTTPYSPPQDGVGPWCVVSVMTVQGVFFTPEHVPYEFDVAQDLLDGGVAWVVFDGHVPLLDQVSVGDVVRDVVVRGDLAGALTYNGQRIQTSYSPLLNLTRSVESTSTSGSLALFFTWMALLGARRPRSVIARSALTGLAGYALLSLCLTMARSDNPGVEVLPFFAATIGFARLAWTVYPIFGPPPASVAQGDILWQRGNSADTKATSAATSSASLAGHYGDRPAKEDRHGRRNRSAPTRSRVSLPPAPRPVEGGRAPRVWQRRRR